MALLMSSFLETTRGAPSCPPATAGQFSLSLHGNFATSVSSEPVPRPAGPDSPLCCPPASPLCPVPWSSRPQLDGAIPGQLRMSGSGARKVCARWTGQSSSSWHTFLLFICCRENGVGPVRAFYNPGKAGRVKI